MRPHRRSLCPQGDTRRTSASGCDAFRASLACVPIGHRRRSRMRSSVWPAHGNGYEVAEPGGGGAPGTDGVVEILRAAADEVEIRIVNPDGSVAEMSGNGTRIAAAWLIEQTGVERVRVRVGARDVEVRALGDGLYEAEMGRVDVSEPETIAGIDVVRVSGG